MDLNGNMQKRLDLLNLIFRKICDIIKENEKGEKNEKSKDLYYRGYTPIP